MKKLIIFPFNGNAIEAIDCLGNEYDLIGLIDDNPEKQGQTQYGFEVFSRDLLITYQETYVLAVPGSPATYLKRRQIIDGLQIPQQRFANVIHPHANISKFAILGYNVLIMAGTVVTSNAAIRNHVCILPNSVIHHDSEVEDYCLIGANVTIAGNVKICQNCYIGSGSTIINNIEIGQKTLVGSGTNVIRSLPSSSKVVGNPGKIIGTIL